MQVHLIGFEYEEQKNYMFIAFQENENRREVNINDFC